MNTHRNNNRRGRGRNNNRNQQGANAGNRIDSRARGNAPQLLDKYKKLAQDAQHNGDRVQAEYYLQFADHYFRVIADNKARQDEARTRRHDERGGENTASTGHAGGHYDASGENNADDARGEQRADPRSDPRNDQRGEQRARGRRPRSRRDEQDPRNIAQDSGSNNIEDSADDEPRGAAHSSAPSSPTSSRSGADIRSPRKPRAVKPASDADEFDISALPPAIGEADAPASVSAPPTRKRAATTSRRTASTTAPRSKRAGNANDDHGIDGGIDASIDASNDRGDLGGDGAAKVKTATVRRRRKPSDDAAVEVAE